MLDGRYRIDAPIARGGMSMVFRGVDTRLDRPVAIKVMDPKFSGDPQFLTRFELEARSVAKLKDPSLVSVYDQGVDGGSPFLIMELVEGGTLRELLRERGPMPPHAVRAVAEPVLRALGAAHASGLVHRDVKPENVLISDSGEVKIADFGLVRAVAGSNLTSSSVILGTAAYLSPEQVSAGNSDSRSDVYAVGVLIFEMLTGRTPFIGDTPLSIAYQRMENDVPAPSELIDGVPAQFDELVTRATAREPAHRFADATAMATELHRVAIELGLPDYRVPAPSESAEHLSARYRVAQPVPEAATAVAPARPVTASTTRIPAEPSHTKVMTAPHPAPQPPPVPAPAAPSPQHHPEFIPDRAKSRQRIVIWSAVVVVLALLLGLGGWWLGVGRYSSVPSIAGMSSERAAVVLKNAGFATTLRDKASDMIPVGGVVGTDPSAGARVPHGSTVAVLVSSGKPKVPAYRPGQDVETVNRLIRDAGLVPVDSGEKPSTAAKGSVGVLEPAAGTVLPTGAQVRVYRSSGSQPVTVPDVSGKTVEEAKAVLRQTGLTVATSHRDEFDQQVPAGQVAATEPAAGTRSLTGSAVTLVVSNAVQVPDVSGLSVKQARNRLEGAGLKVQVNHIFSNDHGTVWAQSPGGGANAAPGSTVTLTVLPF
ncbi:MAG: PASTA domain-containing protein [Nocardia sp.]|nr:PASTA domain-containing protein [Nocardia sp.]